MTAAELMVKCTEALNKTSEQRNRMGCSENWYNPFYAIAQTFTPSEISNFTPQEVNNLIRLANNISEGLF